MSLASTNNLAELLNATLEELEAQLSSGDHADEVRFKWYVAARARMEGRPVPVAAQVAALPHGGGEWTIPSGGFELAIPFPMCRPGGEACLGLVGGMDRWCQWEPRAHLQVLARARAIFRDSCARRELSWHVPDHGIDGDSFMLAVFVSGIVAQRPDLMVSRTVPFLADFAATGSWRGGRFEPVDGSTLALKGGAMKRAGLSYALVVEGQPGVETLRESGLRVIKIPQELPSAREAVAEFLTGAEEPTEEHRRPAIARVNKLVHQRSRRKVPGGTLKPSRITSWVHRLACPRIHSPKVDRLFAKALIDELVCRIIEQQDRWALLYAGISVARWFDQDYGLPVVEPYLRKSVAEEVRFCFRKLPESARCLIFTPWTEFLPGKCELRFSCYPVTERDWEHFDPHFKAVKPDHPRVYVSWLEASCMAWWSGCSLPKPSEWLWQARNNPTIPVFRHNIGKSVLGRRLKVTRHDEDLGSAVFCRDMLGNVWEWCDELGGNRATVLGGCFESEPVLDGFPKSAFMHSISASNIGFRLVQRRRLRASRADPAPE